MTPISEGLMSFQARALCSRAYGWWEDVENRLIENIEHVY
jgi:hypothetical protein